MLLKYNIIGAFIKHFKWIDLMINVLCTHGVTYILVH